MRVRHAHLAHLTNASGFDEQKRHSYVIKVALDIFNITVRNKNDFIKHKNYNCMTGNKQMLYRSYANIWLSYFKYIQVTVITVT